jgi:hypothetical protein
MGIPPPALARPPSRSRRADVQTLAFFDLDDRDYGTPTETSR